MKTRIIRLISSVILFLCALAFDGAVSVVLFVISYLTAGFDVIINAFRGIKNKHILDENFLMTIATVGAFALKEYTEAASVMLFFQIGELFQNYAVRHSRKSISSLLELKAEYATVIRGTEKIKVDPDEVEIGEIIEVLCGEKIPLDGIVDFGESSLDTKALTGEALPVYVTVNDNVYSGSVNISSVLKIKVTKKYEDSSAAKILELVENSAEKKSKRESFITAFSTYYTPIVVVSAVLLAVVPALFGADFKTWLYRALLFLVVSCPCALVISVPLAFFGGIGGCAKKGILIKGGVFIEALSKIKAVCFDKTGTLTDGSFKVKRVCAQNGFSEDELLKYVASAERNSNHPLALSIMNYYDKNDFYDVDNLTEYPGKGLEGNINQKHVLAGNSKLIENSDAETSFTTIHANIDGVYAGFIELCDNIKDDAMGALTSLKNLGVKNTVLLTGDNKHSAEFVAKELEVNEVHSELLPEDKVERFEEIQKNTKFPVCYVGDGINDAPVLARADVGIALGAMGSDSAIEASDVVIMTDNLQNIPKAIKISKKTMNIAKQNTCFAIGVKFAVLVLGAFGVANMWAAIFADVGVSVIAILNSLRCLKNSI